MEVSVWCNWLRMHYATTLFIMLFIIKENLKNKLYTYQPVLAAWYGWLKPTVWAEAYIQQWAIKDCKCYDDGVCIQVRCSLSLTIRHELETCLISFHFNRRKYDFPNYNGNEWKKICKEIVWEVKSLMIWFKIYMEYIVLTTLVKLYFFRLWIFIAADVMTIK